MVELVDALDSKSSVRKDVGVRFSPGPPTLFGNQNSGPQTAASVVVGILLAQNSRFVVRR